MKQILFAFALILMGGAPALSQPLYAPNERVVLLRDPAQRDAYIAQAQKLLASSGKPTIIESKNNPALMLIRAATVSRLDNPPSGLNQLGKAYPNWIENDRSRRLNLMYCTNCGNDTAARRSQPTRSRDPRWRFPQSKRTTIADSSTCCPEKNSSRLLRVSVVMAKGADKVTIAELLEEASRLTADRKVNVVRLTSIFPPEASPLLTAFGQQLTKQTSAVLQPINATKR